MVLSLPPPESLGASAYSLPVPSEGGYGTALPIRVRGPEVEERAGVPTIVGSIFKAAERESVVPTDQPLLSTAVMSLLPLRIVNFRRDSLPFRVQFFQSSFGST